MELRIWYFKVKRWVKHTLFALIAVLQRIEQSPELMLQIEGNITSKRVEVVNESETASNVQMKYI